MLRLGISSVGALLWAALYLLLTAEEFLSLISAVMLHELGHILSLLIMDVGVYGVYLTGSGMRIDFRRSLTAGEEIAAALSGPAFGMLWCVCAWCLDLYLSCRLSAVLTLFNLLPLSLMDGGRAAHGMFRIILGSVWAKRLTLILDALICLGLFTFALFAATHGFGAGASLVAAWISLYVFLHRKNALG